MAGRITLTLDDALPGADAGLVEREPLTKDDAVTFLMDEVARLQAENERLRSLLAAVAFHHDAPAGIVRIADCEVFVWRNPETGDIENAVRLSARGLPSQRRPA